MSYERIRDRAASKILGTDANNELAAVSTTGTGEVVLKNNSTLSGATITLDADPTNALHAVTKQYVDAVATGLDVKASVRAATTANIDLSSAPSSIDGVTLVSGDRVLVKNQTTGSENGIYVFNGTAAAMTRSTDADNSPSGEVTAGMFTFVTEGSISANYGYSLTTPDPITLGTTSLSFSQFSGAGSLTAGDGMVQDGGQFNIVGTADRILVNPDNIDIASTYVGQTSITTLGTITTGVWSGSVISSSVGGTGTTSSTGSGSNVLSASPTLTGTISAEAMTLSSTLSVSGIQTNATDLVLSASIGLIRSNTSDGADNKVVTITGGGAEGSTRGGRIDLYGNEQGNTGRVNVVAGNVAGSKIQFTTADTLRYDIDHSGTHTFASAVVMSSTLAVTGDVTVANATSTGAVLTLESTDIGGTNWKIASGGSSNGAFPTGSLTFRDSTVGTNRLVINSAGLVSVPGTLSVTGAATLASILTMSGGGAIEMKTTSATNQYLTWYKGGTLRWAWGVDSSDRSVFEAYNGSGVAIDSPIIIANTAAGAMILSRPVSLSSSLTFAAGQDIIIADNHASALTITQSGNPYLRFTTTDGSESISIYKATSLSSTLTVAGASNGVAGDQFIVVSADADSKFRLGNNANNSIDLNYTRSDGVSVLSINGHSMLASFGGAVSMSSTLGVTGILTSSAAGGGSSSGIAIASGSPGYAWHETDATTDNKWWDILANTEQLRFRAVDDANTGAGTYMLVDRTGIVIDSVTFPAAVILSSTLSVAGTTTVSGISSSGDITVTKTAAASLPLIQSINSDNTNTSSHAQIRAQVAGSSAGDPSMRWVVSGIQTWSMGIDNSDSDALVIGGHSNLGTNTAMRFDNATLGVSVLSTLAVSGITTVASDLRFSGTTINIRPTTSDTSDTGRITLSAGGSDNGDVNRGAYISLRGNENGSAGAIQIVAGNAVGGVIAFYTGSSIVAMTINESQVTTFSNTVSISSSSAKTFEILNSGATAADVVVGTIGFGKSSIVSNGTRAGIKASYASTGYVADSNVGMNLEFYTSTDSSGDGAQRMKIAANGAITMASTLGVTGAITASSNVTLNSSASDNSNQLSINMSSGQPYGSGLKVTTTASDFSAPVVYITKSAGSLNSTNGSYLLIDDGTNTLFRVSSAGSITAASDIVFSNANGYIRANTADAADTNAVSIVGGGQISSLRGASVRVFGNENSGDPGVLELMAGNVTGGKVRIHAAGDWRYETTSTGGHSFLSAVSMSSTLVVTGSTKFGVGSPSTEIGIASSYNNLTGNSPIGISSNPTFPSTATSTARAGFFVSATAAASFTMASMSGVYVGSGVKGVGSTITDNYGLYIENQTVGNTNYSIYTGTGLVRFGNDSIIVATAKTPASATAAGTQGMVAWDANFIYVCTATNTWKRSAISSW